MCCRAKPATTCHLVTVCAQSTSNSFNSHPIVWHEIVIKLLAATIGTWLATYRQSKWKILITIDDLCLLNCNQMLDTREHREKRQILLQSRFYTFPLHLHIHPDDIGRVNALCWEIPSTRVEYFNMKARKKKRKNHKSNCNTPFLFQLNGSTVWEFITGWHIELHSNGLVRPPTHLPTCLHACCLWQSSLHLIGLPFF